MLGHLVYGYYRLLLLTVCTPKALFDHGLAAAPKRLLIFTLAIPLLFFWQTFNWLALLLDELLFFQYRRCRIDAPIFITGIPRSGTTFLQRTLAQDSQFTTTKLWELLAPALCQKVVIRWFASIGGEKKSTSKWLGRLTAPMENIHSLGLDEAEEDFLFLLQINACFILVVLFPSANAMWRLAFFDRKLPRWEQNIILGFYTRCVQRHLYFHQRIKKSLGNPNPPLTYLAKNPSFSPLIVALTRHFPDARFAVCAREPVKTVPSQISSLLPALKLTGNGKAPRVLIDRCIDMLHFYYRHLNVELISQNRAPLVPMKHLKSQLHATVCDLYGGWGLSIPLSFAEALVKSDNASRRYTSEHGYALSDFELDAEQLNERFNDVWPLTTREEKA